MAELLVEASFADLRHCGDGDLTKAYDLLKKVSDGLLITFSNVCIKIKAHQLILFIQSPQGF